MATSKRKGDAGRRSVQYSKPNKVDSSANERSVKFLPGAKTSPGIDFSNIPIYANDGAVQPKLFVNKPGDQYEQEADRIANKVVQSNDDGSQEQLSKNINPMVQAKGDVSGSINEPLNNKINSSKGSGASLDKETQSFMSGRFGADFSKVKIHADDESAAMNNEINAKAFTVGNDIYFNKEQYKPGTQEGKQLLAHELTHVVQQKSSPAHGSIQRDKNENSQYESDAKLNFKNDWENNFSNYDDLLKDAIVVYDGNLKGNIKATRKGTALTITLGKTFATETEEAVRWPWIKTEIIDKFATTDRFQDAAFDPTHTKMKKVNPPVDGRYCRLNCPAAASAFDEYLRTGVVKQAHCDPDLETTPGYGFDVSKNNFSKTYTKWTPVQAEVKKLLKTHGSSVVIEAKRSPEQMKSTGSAEYHYFVILNVNGKLFVTDAYGGGKTAEEASIGSYVTSLQVSTFRIAKDGLKVEKVVPK